LFSERARFADRTITVVGVVAFSSPPTGASQRFTIQDGPNSIEAFRVTLR
jgi:hypothetical protein